MATIKSEGDTPATDSVANNMMWPEMSLGLYNGSSSRHGNDDDDDSELMGKADTPASDSQWWHKVPLVLYDDSSCRHGDDDDDEFEPMSKADTPASDSQAANTLVLCQGSSSRHGDDDDGFMPMDDELDIVARHVESYVPLTTVMPESLENGPEKWPWPVLRYTGETYKRRRRRPAGPKSSENKIEQNPVLFDGNSGKSNHNKGDEDGDFEPPTPTKKRRRQAGYKSAKQKTEQKILLLDSSSDDDMQDNDVDYEPERKKKNKRKKVPTKKPVLRRKSKLACGSMKSPDLETDGFTAKNLFEELKLQQYHAAKKLRNVESRLSVSQNFLKKFDVEMKQMLEAHAKEKRYQALRMLATTPW